MNISGSLHSENSNSDATLYLVFTSAWNTFICCVTKQRQQCSVCWVLFLIKSMK